MHWDMNNDCVHAHLRLVNMHHCDHTQQFSYEKLPIPNLLRMLHYVQLNYILCYASIVKSHTPADTL